MAANVVQFLCLQSAARSTITATEATKDSLALLRKGEGWAEGFSGVSHAASGGKRLGCAYRNGVHSVYTFNDARLASSSREGRRVSLDDPGILLV